MDDLGSQRALGTCACSTFGIWEHMGGLAFSSQCHFLLFRLLFVIPSVETFRRICDGVKRSVLSDRSRRGWALML